MLEKRAEPLVTEELKLTDTGVLTEVPCMCNAIPVGI
jgi:hypothetical protein